MSDEAEYKARNREMIGRMAGDQAFAELGKRWFLSAFRHEYPYHFTWLGLPIIQFPQDIVALQEIIWSVQPDLIVETGVARGGSIIFHASMLQLIGGDGVVVGVDVDIRAHNRAALEKHRLFSRVRLIQGSSVSEEVIAQVRKLAEGRKQVLVVLDSNHTREHVLAELRAYAPLVRQGSYLVVLDTIIESLTPDLYRDRPWSAGNNAATAVEEFLRTTDRFEVDAEMDAKLQISVAPRGFLRCVKD
jgi:cephalosporin hydroxylase